VRIAHVLAIIVASWTLGHAGTVAVKSSDSAVERARALKASGQRVPSALWQAARDEMAAGRLEALASLDLAPSDGGSNAGNATLVDANPYVDSGTTVGKGNNALLPSCLSGGSDTAEDAWYRLVLPYSSRVTLWTTCGSGGFDTRLGIFDSLQVLLTCNDDNPTCASPYYRSLISDYELPAGTYYIVVDGYSGATGSYELNLEWIISPGACQGGSDPTNAEVITAVPLTATGSTIGACHNFGIDCELGGAGDDEDYWYTLSLDTTVFIDVWTTCDGASIDTRLAVLDTELNALYCNDDDPACVTGQSRIEHAFLYAGDYFIVVEGSYTASGPYTLNLDTTVVTPDSNTALLPDIIVRESDLYDHDISTTVSPGRTHLRLSNGTANIGPGKLYLYGTGVDNGDGTENILQRIYSSEGGYYDRTAGAFTFHPTHNHIHVEDWCEYRLREVLPNNGVGLVIAKGQKTSFCILDLQVYDSSIPGFNPSGQFLSCGSTVQGLSVGWIDVYSKGLPGQNIDITDVPPGTYWLESSADPLNTVLEADETNNASRIKVTLGGGPAINPDPFEPNETRAAVDSRPPGGVNSPNLGPCNPERLVADLTMHVAGNDDYFKFYMNDTGTTADFVRIDFNSLDGDLDLYLLDEAGVPLDSSVTNSGTEMISLSGRPEGWWYARVVGLATTISSYSLRVNPSANSPAYVTVTAPPEGTAWLIQGVDIYTVTWTVSNPDSDLTWVSIYANTTPALDGNEFLLPTTLFTPGDQGFAIINTAYLGLGYYWFYAKITDGGSATGSWSPGNLRMLDPATGVDPTTPVVASTRLHAAVPNPFNPITRLRLDLAHDARVAWAIYDVHGRLVRTLAAGPLAAGVHHRTWDGTDGHGRPVASGVYFQRVLMAGGAPLTGKLVLLK